MSWDDLKPWLIEAAERRPSPLLAYPDPRVAGGRRAPFRIRLAAWAADLARELLDRFGDEVVLVVGCLSFPDGRRVDGTGRPWQDPPQREATPIDAADLDVDLAADVVVASGHELTTDLTVTNHTRAPLDLLLPPDRDATLVDPEDGTAVGGHVPGGRLMQRRTLVVAARSTTAVPVRIGTAAYDLRTGWAVPPGSWALRAYLQRRDGRTLRLPLLPITVT